MKGSRTRCWNGWLVSILGVAFCLGAPFPSIARIPATTVTCRVELDREVLPANEEQTAVLKITLDAPKPPEAAERPPVNLCVVLDRSGSMSGQKLDRAKEAAIEALRRLGPKDMFSLVVYDHNVETIVPAQSAANTEWIEGRIRQISSGGNTALFGAVSQGAAEVRKNLQGRFINRIILLSDGLANVGPSSPSDLGRLGAGFMKEGISVSTVGVGTDYNEDLMTRLSQESDGNSYFVEDSRDLARIFSEELGDVLSVVARKVKVVIECPSGVTPITIIGREGRIVGRNVELSLNQIYGGQQKFILLQVQVPKGRNGERREIATARISYENPLTEKEESASGHAVGRYSENRDEVDRSANLTVQRAYHLNVSAETQTKVIALSDEGKTAEAAAVLNESAAKLEAIGGQYNDDELRSRAASMKKQADQIEADGMKPSYRKVIRTESYQIRNQQRAQ